MASLLCRLTWCDGVRCLARVMTHVASLLCSLVELVAWSTSLALLRLMKKYSRDVIIIHGARRRELPLPQKPFQKVWTKMEGKGSVHNLPWRKLDRWDQNCIVKSIYFTEISLIEGEININWPENVDMQLKVEFLVIVLNIAFVQEDKVLNNQDDPLLH